LQQRFKVPAKQLRLRFLGRGGHITAIDAGLEPILDDFLSWVFERVQVRAEILVFFGQWQV